MPSSRWKPRDPQRFPVHFADCVLAAATEERPVILTQVRSKEDARKYLDKFREWRFCLRNSPNVRARGWDIEHNYRIKTYLAESELGLLVYVEVKSKIMPILKKLNPHLAECFSY